MKSFQEWVNEDFEQWQKEAGDQAAEREGWPKPGSQGPQPSLKFLQQEAQEAIKVLKELGIEDVHPAQAGYVLVNTGEILSSL